MLVIRARIHKMLVRIANSLILVGTVYQATSVGNFRTFTVHLTGSRKITDSELIK